MLVYVRFYFLKKEKKKKKKDFIFSSPILMYRKSYCPILSLGMSGDRVSKMLKFLCDGLGAVRRAMLYMDRSCGVTSD